MIQCARFVNINIARYMPLMKKLFQPNHIFLDYSQLIILVNFGRHSQPVAGWPVQRV